MSINIKLFHSGNAAFPSAGTTNLHIDMSDAVNVMVSDCQAHIVRYGNCPFSVNQPSLGGVQLCLI